MMFQPGLTMKTVQLLRRGLAAVALLSVCASPALAEDIDIFAAGQGGEGGVANILLVLDNGKVVADGPKDAVIDALRKGRIGSAL